MNWYSDWSSVTLHDNNVEMEGKPKGITLTIHQMLRGGARKIIKKTFYDLYISVGEIMAKIPIDFSRTQCSCIPIYLPHSQMVMFLLWFTWIFIIKCTLLVSDFFLISILQCLPNINPSISFSILMELYTNYDKYSWNHLNHPLKKNYFLVQLLQWNSNHK